MTTRSLSPLQRRRIQQAIHDGHLAFVAEVFGPSAIDPDDYDRLRAAGKIRDERLLPQDAALAAHALGAVAEHAEAHPSAELLSTPEMFWQHVGDDLHLTTEAEREAVASLRDRIHQHVRALGNKLDDAVGRILLEADDDVRRRRMVGGRSDKHFDAPAVLARIRDAVNALRREWLRTAHTEVHNASEEAKAIAMSAGGRDPMVFKRPHADACAHCRLLYLKPDGVTPRVFRLSALLANGTNVGRRAGRPTRSGRSRTEWKAVVGAVHPWCQCPLHVLGDGMKFDRNGKVVYVGAAKSIEVDRLDAPINHVCEE